MADFKKMYIELFRSQTKAINLLQEAQQATEDMFIDAEPPDIRLLTSLRDDTNPEPEPIDEKE